MKLVKVSVPFRGLLILYILAVGFVDGGSYGFRPLPGFANSLWLFCFFPFLLLKFPSPSGVC